MPNHTLIIQKLGPIKKVCFLSTSSQYLPGRNPMGKTSAKAVYFFRTIKQDILNIIMQGGPSLSQGEILLFGNIF